MRSSRHRRRATALVLALASVVSTTLATGTAATWPPEINDIARATPRATCGPGSAPESDLQGRVPAGDYASGRANDPYTCNTELVGHFGITGGFQVHRYIDDGGRECAFYDSTLIWGKDIPKGNRPGVYAMDMSDPSDPRRSAILTTPAMQSPHESLRLSAERGLLFANMGYPATAPGFVDVYDVSADCRDPQLLSTLPLAVAGHEGGLSPDGLTYWATTTAAPGITAIDVSDPAAPTIVWRSNDYAVHGLSISSDGARAYLATVVDFVSGTSMGGGGLTILDITDIRDRVPDPQVSVISTLTWPEVTIPQNIIETVIDGERYLIEFDEFDRNVYVPDVTDQVGGVRIIDLDDPAQPNIVSSIRLEVHQMEARPLIADDPGFARAGQGYAAHYCSIPRYEDPGILACSMIGSGLRVFDIRDPEEPREIAYFNRPLVSGPDPSESGAYAMSAPAFAPERGEIWYSDSNTGFFVVRLTNGAWHQ